jgi:hypothetical protein
MAEVTEKQLKYINRLLADADTDEMVKALFIRSSVGRKVAADLSDLDRKEAAKVIGDLLAVQMGFDCRGDDEDDNPFPFES